MHAKFDQGDYRDEVTVTLRIPLAMPYSYDRVDFDRVNGVFEHRGELYRLVEKKLDNDTLTVVCVVDGEHKRINNAFESYVKTFQDTPGDHPSGVHTVSLIKDYLMNGFCIEQGSSGWSATLANRSQFLNPAPAFLKAISIPPESQLI